MSIQRSPRVDRDTAEQLVAGQGVGPVAALLCAAAAPAHQDELAGEEAAVAAFRSASVAAVPHKRSVFRSALTKALTVKAVIVMAVAGSTGIVLAASEGALPMPWSNGPAAPPLTTTTTPAPNSPTGRTSDDRQSPASPDPAIVGLCEAYRAHDDKNLDNPAFRALVDEAGGKDKVAGYCEIVESTAPGKSGAPSVTTGKPDDPSEGDRQDNPPVRTSSVTGRPSERPGVTEPPTEPKQTGKPSKTARTTGTTPTSEPADEDAVTKTPGSPAPGAATAVPPSSAEPPSEGG